MWKKTQNPGDHDFNLNNPDCLSLLLWMDFFTSVSKDPRAHDFLLFNGHVFPIISYRPNITRVPALWKAMLPEHL